MACALNAVRPFAASVLQCAWGRRTKAAHRLDTSCTLGVGRAPRAAASSACARAHHPEAQPLTASACTLWAWLGRCAQSRSKQRTWLSEVLLFCTAASAAKPWLCAPGTACTPGGLMPRACRWAGTAAAAPVKVSEALLRSAARMAYGACERQTRLRACTALPHVHAHASMCVCACARGGEGQG